MKGKLNICLSFDDATFDFYHIIYPLLRKHGLKALLAVPAGYIIEKSPMPPDERMNLLDDFSFENSPPGDAFCTYQELKEMSESGNVKIASHGMYHQNLGNPNIDLKEELPDSKELLEKKLNTEISTFVFPYGRYNQLVLKEASKHYKNVMRIGNAVNFSWTPLLHYRVNADGIKEIRSIISPQKRIQYFLKQVVAHFT